MQNTKISVIGLGYVGLPLAAALAKHFNTTGFDINAIRIAELENQIDITGELTANDFKQASNLQFTTNEKNLSGTDIFIITVPTPVDQFNTPDLSALITATKLIAKYVSKKTTIVYESTVYPGATEEVCVPIIEKYSGLTYNEDFTVGYSPERINPGDKIHTITNIIKVVAGSNLETTKRLAQIYGKIVKAGVYCVNNIKVAEAAKVIENTQRDVNIALINELSRIFDKMDIPIHEVLKAAATKWNFLNFEPGLVGGHCIGVDPYYLIHKSQSFGYSPNLIIDSRRVNDDYARFLAEKFIRNILTTTGERKLDLAVFGLTFKENCPDTRNSKVFDVIEILESYGFKVDCFDPWIKDSTVENRSINPEVQFKRYAGVFIAVSHDEFKDLGADYFKSISIDNGTIFDLKNIFPNDFTFLRL